MGPKLLWNGLPPKFLDLPLIMPYPPIDIEIFSTPSPTLFNILKTPYPPFVNGGRGGGQTMLNMFTEFSIFVAFFQKEFNPLRISFFKTWVEYFVMLGCFKCYLVHKIFLHWIFVWSLLKENKTTLKTSTSLVEEFETNQI